MYRMRRLVSITAILSMVLLLAPPLSAGAQTRVKPGMNFFSLEQDVKFGREAASEIERQMQMINDPLVQRWIDELGHRIASNTSMPNLPWRFRVVNSAEINAFALPGGFVYVNRGLIAIADDESELAGVMGHEMSHVTLRHGTNQLSKSLMAQMPLAVLGQMGGMAGSLGQLGGVGLSMAFLKFSRTDETQADVVGAQVMTRAGYDPQGMVRIFQKLQQQGAGRGTPQFLSDHPNPANRIQRIQQEIGMLRAPANPLRSSELFYEVKEKLQAMPGAPRVNPRSGGTGNPRRTGTGRASRPGEAPSRSTTSYQAPDGFFNVSYPSNWEAFSQTGRNVTFAPEWALEGNDVTRGAIVSFFDPQDQSRGRMNLNTAMDTVIDQLEQGNQYLREEQRARYSGRLSGREALATFLSGQSSEGYTERVWLIVRPSGQGIIYMLFIAPEREFGQYEPAFQAMIRSFSINDSRRSGY